MTRNQLNIEYSKAMDDKEKEPEEPKHPVVSAINSLGCLIIVIVFLLLWAASCGVGPWK